MEMARSIYHLSGLALGFPETIVGPTFISAVMANAECSQAGLLALDCKPGAPPALAGTTG